MNSRPSYYHNHSSFSNNSLAICKEIQRFESVHPSIYAIYDLIEVIPDPIVAQQVRDHVVCIEGKPSFINIWVVVVNIFNHYDVKVLAFNLYLTNVLFMSCKIG